MKSKILLIVPLALLALSIVASVRAAPTWYITLQLEITDFIFVEFVPGVGTYFAVPFEGVAVGPDIKEGTVEGVDLLLIDLIGIAHVDVYLTITDKDGDKISANAKGFSVDRNPSQKVFEGLEPTIINQLGYPTTGKYFDAGLVGTKFRSEGFISDFSSDPPGGYIHAKWYWP